ncbi:OsmC family protein [Microtetraspora glauca]|uniref:OsmC family protein n=1 Tax=Microtetraspora glauca TaxID=1996 RepID=A0ABV3GL17_MICGL
MARPHTYETIVTWTGDRGTGTSGPRDYSPDVEIAADGPGVITGSSDPAFGGDPARWNPEQLLVASLSQCHLLWYLFLCARAGVVVTTYLDRATGDMTAHADGGRFTEVVLRPQVTVADSAMTEEAVRLHAEAHRNCYIAKSVAFPVRCEPVVSAAELMI